MPPRIIFITGTDTGVGKTVLTSLLLSYLRRNHFPVLALKPFCTGGRADAQLLHALQNGELTLDEINPFHFKEPLAPLVAARLHRRKIPLRAALDCIQRTVRKLRTKHSKSKTSPVLLIEGAGGLLAPLGESRPSSRFSPRSAWQAFHVSPRKAGGSFYTALDIIKALNCEVIVVAPNRLGVINHTLLTVHALQLAGLQSLGVVLNTQYAIRNTHHASRTNPSTLSELLTPTSLVGLPYLGSRIGLPNRPSKKLSPILAKILSQNLADHSRPSSIADLTSS